MNFFRLQFGEYTLKEMQAYVSEDGGDDRLEDGGLCACDSVSSLLSNTVWDGRDYPGAEVVIFEGQILADIYDGYRVYPTRILTRVKPSEFSARRNQIAEQYEKW